MNEPAARLDAAGVALSALCAVHCLAVPLVATGALAWLAGERVHAGLAVAVGAVVAAVAVPGWRRHRRGFVPALLVVGGALLGAALAAGDGAETALTLAGSGLLVAGHAFNLRLPDAR